MDIFKFKNPSSATKMEQGEIINKIDKKLWVERYDVAGEFKFTAKLKSGLRELLPIDTCVSHVDSKEIMVVEDHEINDERGKETEIIITGRSLEAYILDNRLIGTNRAFPITSGVEYDHLVPDANVGGNILSLIQSAIDELTVLDIDDAFPWIDILNSDVAAAPGFDRTYKRGPLYNKVLELLASDKLGIRVYRPGPWKTIVAPDGTSELIIHRGEDKSADVVFSYDSGEIENADYFWSSRTDKNYAYVAGRWVQTLVPGTGANFGRKMIFVDATWIDEGYETAPVGADYTLVLDNMEQFGRDVVAARNKTTIANVEISKAGTRYRYRDDYEVGDIVMVNGDYDAAAAMRVSEYVEIEDETGSHSYPTLVLP